MRRPAAENTRLIVKQNQPQLFLASLPFPPQIEERKMPELRLFPEDAGQVRAEGDDAFNTCCRSAQSRAFY